MRSLLNEVKAKTKVICSSRLCGWLMFNGFHLVSIKNDIKNSKRNVFIFNDTQNLTDCIADYEINKARCKFY